MEDILTMLYRLQRVDSSLDDLEDMKGDLPEAVATLQTEVDRLNGLIKTQQDIVTSSVVARDKADVDILEFKEKLEKYKKQQYEVRSNKEYDALTKEIDFATESIKTLQKQFETLESAMTAAKAEIETLTKQLEEQQAILNERKAELAEVSKANEDEELGLKHQREKIVVRLKADTLSRYDRIRKARNGKAVVPVKRNSCGGCHNRIPPQRLLEIRTQDKIFMCEHCGRILISAELAQATEAAA
ncbi:MAG TPA: C4-type zinc ribbon domain-containing protein [Bacteroidota bacterium]|nr:C4-type zinc ribbon domain-containing protein [Bacteroidota bacterium]